MLGDLRVDRLFPWLLAMAVALAIYCLLTPAPAVAASTSADRAEVLDLANDYLRHRCDSLVTLKAYQRPLNIEPNARTAVALNWDELEVDGARGLGTGWADYSLKTRTPSVSVRGSTASLILIADIDYHYKISPTVDSGIYNVIYKFRLRRSGSTWRITAIESDYDGYRVLRDEVSALLRSGASFNASLASVRMSRKAGLESLVREVRRSEKEDRFRAYEFQPAVVPSGSYSYNITRGVSYANRFAPKSAPRWFYYVSGGDCTNFVSQCVWAAYGGYTASDDTQSKSNIANKVRMVPNVWHAGTGGGMTKWESVDALWAYATSSKTLGPTATGFNNNKKYTSMKSTDLEVGNVLQVRTASTSGYRHSVYVSRLDAAKSGWSRWYVCQHSSDMKDRALTDLINAWGSSNCYMRRLRFGSANFNK